MRKAQITTEAIFTTAMIICVFTIVVIIALNQSIGLNRLNKELSQKNECLKVANLIVYTYINGNTNTVKLSYPIIINANTRTVFVNNRTSCSIPINQITSNEFQGNNITLSKQGDFINVQ